MDPIEELLSRGVDKIYPSPEALEKVLRSGKKLKLYQGFDPTGTQLHIGHLIGLRKLAQWQALGHQVIFLIGDFTAMVGDPSGKTSTRKMLSHEEVQKNGKEYIKQAGRILKFEEENPVKVLYNGKWLGALSAIDFLKISSLLSVQQVVERDMFQERQKQGQEVFMNEFLYPVMQAYDSVAMEVDLEIGGTDQMFNMMMGRRLMKKMIDKEKFVMTTPLLEDSQGRKIGKTEGNVIALTDKPNELFAKIMSLGDDIIIKGLTYLTDVPMDKIHDLEQHLKDGENPIDYKKQLAFELTKQLNDEKSAQKAQETFETVVQKQELPSVIPTLEVKPPALPIEVVLQSNLVSSKGEAKRLLEQGGVKIDGHTATLNSEVKNGSIMQIGKRGFRKIKIDK